MEEASNKRSEIQEQANRRELLYRDAAAERGSLGYSDNRMGRSSRPQRIQDVPSGVRQYAKGGGDKGVGGGGAHMVGGDAGRMSKKAGKDGGGEA